MVWLLQVNGLTKALQLEWQPRAMKASILNSATILGNWDNIHQVKTRLSAWICGVVAAAGLFAEGGGGVMLEWMGKKKVVNHHNDVPFLVLERETRTFARSKYTHFRVSDIQCHWHVVAFGEQVNAAIAEKFS